MLLKARPDVLLKVFFQSLNPFRHISLLDIEYLVPKLLNLLENGFSPPLESVRFSDAGRLEDVEESRAIAAAVSPFKPTGHAVA